MAEAKAAKRVNKVVGQLENGKSERVSTSFFPSAKVLEGFRASIQTLVRESPELPFKADDLNEKALKFDPKEMNVWLEPYEREQRQKMLDFLCKNPIFQNKDLIGLNIPEARDLLFRMAVAACGSGFLQLRDQIERPLRWASALEPLSYIGPALGTKVGVHYMLYSGSILNVGSKEQVDKWIDDMQHLRMRGAFCLTELGHGSNARDIETQAIWDEKEGCFVINTPSDSAQKYWIGNLAQHCTHALVFAQLRMQNKDLGVHAFVVQVRDEQGKTVENVTLGDCGPKAGLNGIDNGRGWFHNKKVPRENLLSKFAEVTPDGKYIKKTENVFASTIGALVGGRVFVGQGALSIARLGLSIAIRYGAQRKQFGPPGKSEIPILDYTSHQLRLFPLLAENYALQSIYNYTKSNFASGKFKDPQEIHILASGLKPAATWHRAAVLQNARECCGGQGFHAANRIGPLKTDADIDVTWEGDNTVLLQQVSSYLLKEFRSQFSKGKRFTGMLSYLRRQMELETRDISVRNRANSEHLLSMEVYRNAMEYREARLLRELVNRLRVTQKMGAFEAWNDAQHIALHLAQAHVERLTLEKFSEDVEKAQPSLKPMLHLLCSLYALSKIQADMGYFMRLHYFSAKKAAAIQEQIVAICRALKPHAIALCDAYNIPDDLLGAPAAFDLVAANAIGKTPGYPIYK